MNIYGSAAFGEMVLKRHAEDFIQDFKVFLLKAHQFPCLGAFRGVLKL